MRGKRPKEHMADEDRRKERICSIPECRGRYTLMYSIGCEERHIMEAENVCFGCAFWKNVIKGDRNSKRAVVVNGGHHWIGNEKSSGFKGFGGAKWKIRFNDGREVETTNLWHQGTIPEHFREDLPDNATFLTP